ncbi:MAG: glutathione-dependent formaldehyde dehydrogenase [Bdellovibrionales bacterium CG10_big_fil_rev_8_21_14_0_10_45_34]|nr:MAG: glutathione-dependent formaldehyde dehydrogenase [Bdellovibrionales bacterium CG10_big_fil_rev_8_21_14_0_10_45_34]
MKALTWQGKQKVDLMNVPDPRVLSSGDVIVKVTTSAICGSDLHLYNGYVPTMKKGDILGHETMGEVVEVGPLVKTLKAGDRIVIPFDIGCGKCHHCKVEEYSACDNSNPNAIIPDELYGQSGAAAFGFSHMMGGYAGGQAEYIRLPFADTNSLIVPQGIDDEKVLFLSDIFPTGYMAAENCNIKRGDTVAVWGAGPVGQMCIRSAFLLGAERVIAIDHFEGRLKMAADSGAETINYEDADELVDELKALTGGRGPDSCIDAVGLEAHGQSITSIRDRVEAAVGLVTDRIDALRLAIMACKKGGTVSVPGVYAGFSDHFPFGAAFGKGLTFKMGQTHTQKYMKPLLKLILEDKIDPSFVITHRMEIDEGSHAYEIFSDQKDECIKVVLKMH